MSDESRGPASKQQIEKVLSHHLECTQECWHGSLGVRVDCVDIAGCELNHLHLREPLLPWAGDAKCSANVVGVHQHVDERIEESSKVAITTALDLWGTKYDISVKHVQARRTRRKLTLQTNHQAQAMVK